VFVLLNAALAHTVRRRGSTHGSAGVPPTFVVPLIDREQLHDIVRVFKRVGFLVVVIEALIVSSVLDLHAVFDQLSSPMISIVNLINLIYTCPSLCSVILSSCLVGWLLYINSATRSVDYSYDERPVFANRGLHGTLAVKTVTRWFLN